MQKEDAKNDVLIKFIVQKLNAVISVFDDGGEPIKDFVPEDSSQEAFRQYIKLLLPEFRNIASEQLPYLILVNDYQIYICFRCFSIRQFIVIGPLHLAFQEENDHACYRLTNSTIQSLSTDNGIDAVPVVYPPVVFSYSTLLFNFLTESDMAENDVCRLYFNSDFVRPSVSRSTNEYLFSNRENGKTHNPYNQEVRLLNSIETGDVAMLKRIWGESSEYSLGQTAADPIRNGKNLAIYNVTACGRAAIRGGLSAEYVFTLTDAYTRTIEDLKDMMILQSIVEDAELHFAESVADLKEEGLTNNSGNPLIRKCKDYVFKNLHGRLTVNEIAEQLEVHPNYLGKVFQEQEGLSLHMYITKEKINLAKNLLVYSNYPCADIAQYLGFASQSHLGSTFKKVTGMTLKKYRDSFRAGTGSPESCWSKN